MTEKNIVHIVGFLITGMGAVMMGWAPHNGTYGVILIFGGIITILSASQLATLEKALGKLPDAASLVGLLSQLSSSLSNLSGLSLTASPKNGGSSATTMTVSHPLSAAITNADPHTAASLVP